MAANFTFGGTQPIVVHRTIIADRWIPDPAATVKMMDGTTYAPAATEMAATTASNGSGGGTAVGSGFFQMENVPVSIWFTGLVNATVELQVLNPITTTWETFIASDKWLDEPGKVLLAPSLPWRVGCVTLGGDTLAVNVAFVRAEYNRHA